MSDRPGRRHGRYDDYPYDDYYERPPRHRSLGRQALDKLEGAMESLGLNDTRSHHSHSSSGGARRRRSRDDRAVAQYYPPSSHSHRRYNSTSPPRRSRRSRRDSSSSHHRASSRSRSRWERGVQAAAEAAAVEAFRLRHEPGPWKGEKGQRIATAAISAGVIGAATETRKQEGKGGKLGTLGSAVAGLAVNRLVNGPRDEVSR
ncbi:hypothetical protein C8A03DRAFT_46105 [Achaetomium macrosporum]|uniref:Uncharacterized protein n=1 Tax=Achaetomium macrosporum TaxID=79813 RepID=A0AAN7C6A6_9PEZI|nr:hypothetical protein C8A03DRAFT_46105 [Achaetomium macrosporum]